jgi:hypothetical protein
LAKDKLDATVAGDDACSSAPWSCFSSTEYDEAVMVRCEIAATGRVV